MKTLNEVIEIIGLKRRAIQEYEDAGLAKKPEHKNKYGYLLYDEQEVERLWQLRFYKELGYNITKIKSIFEDEVYKEQEELEKVIIALKEKQEKLENLISVAELMKQTGLSFNTLRHSVEGLDSINSDNVFSLLGSAFNTFKGVDADKIFNTDIFTDEELDEIADALEALLDCCEKNRDIAAEEVQKKITAIHQLLSKAISESVFFLKWSLILLSPEGEIAQDLAKEIGEDRVVFLHDALQHYCSSNAETSINSAVYEVFDNIERLGRKKYTTNSVEVQAEVKKLHEFIMQVNILTEEGKFDLLQRYGRLFGSKAYMDLMDNGAKRGVAWFTSRAIEIYCENLLSEKTTSAQ